MSEPLIGNILDSRYQLLQKVGQGGFGETFLAADLKRPHHPKCIVKRLLPQSRDSFVLETARRLFIKEAEVLEELGKHDRIPALLAYFEDGGEFYLVQEFIDGEDLAGKTLGLTEKQTKDLIREILEILQFIHNHGVIHRDIKPANLIRRKADGKLVAIDFGAVKQIRNQSLTEIGKNNISVAVGTPGYMPSEQANGKPRFNSDIYATGMLAIEALTGVYASDLPTNTHTGELVWQDRVLTTLSLGFEQVLSKMVRDHFRDRYQTVSEVLQDLDALPQSKTEPTIIQDLNVQPHPHHLDMEAGGSSVNGNVQSVVSPTAENPSPGSPPRFSEVATQLISSPNSQILYRNAAQSPVHSSSPDQGNGSKSTFRVHHFQKLLIFIILFLGSTAAGVWIYNQFQSKYTVSASRGIHILHQYLTKTILIEAPPTPQTSNVISSPEPSLESSSRPPSRGQPVNLEQRDSQLPVSPVEPPPVEEVPIAPSSRDCSEFNSC